VEQLGDKLAQVTGEWKAVEDYFNEEISGALVVVAYPLGKPTIITIERWRFANVLGSILGKSSIIPP
jgi:hypothetical protein